MEEFKGAGEDEGKGEDEGAEEGKGRDGMSPAIDPVSVYGRKRIRDRARTSWSMMAGTALSRITSPLPDNGV